MSRFYSTRQALNAVDASRSSTSSLDPALSALSPEDAEVLEAIVAMSPEATTFMTVFKAYSEVLQQRGLDPGNDVVYYKQLLKLGVVKGVNWGTKWNIVKNQLGLDLGAQTVPRPERRILPSQLSGLPAHEENVFTLHSHADETETAVDRQHVGGVSFRRPKQPTASWTTDGRESFDLHSELSFHRSSPPRGAARHPTMFPNRMAQTFSDESDVLDDVPIRSSTPPLPRYRKERSHSPTPNPKFAKGKGREQSPGHLNEAEAWKKVEQERQIQVADQFRRESLLSRCFETWKVGLGWIRSTHSQIEHARNHIQLRISFERWRERNARVKDVHERASRVAHFRTQSASFNVWREKTRRRQISRWREGMRSRMSRFKQTRDERIRNDVWTKWRQLHRSRQLYARNVLARIFRRWREKLHRLAALEFLADGFEDARERKTLENVMDTWSRRVQLRDAERYLTQKVAQRTLALAFETWIRAAQDNHYADAHHASQLRKRVFSAWKKAQESMHALSSRGDKHLRRRDNLLLRAVVRVWVSRERGQLLARVRGTRLMKDAFVVWQQRQQEQHKLQDAALAFARQSSGLTLVSTFQTWARRCHARRNALTLGEQHYAATLLNRVLFAWRLQLRAKLKMARRAKMARTYILERHAWDRWRFAVMENRRKRKLRQLEKKKLKQVFSSWLDVTRRRRHRARATYAIQQLVQKHIMRHVLQHWTNRVVNLKLRELDTIEQFQRECLLSAFTKWREMCHRHGENLSLVNSFQDVKREDTLRRTFLKWLATARKSQSRRIRLAEREHELRLEIIGAAWETWRDRFRENMLRDIEYRVIIQNQTNLIYHAFLVWKSRSKSVPGIRFYATNVKSKVWARWRAAMPRAVQARKAREMDAKHVQTAALRKWIAAHRAKLALKAVARARYLRLPSPGQRAAGAAPLRPLLHRPLRAAAAREEDGAGPRRASTPPFAVRRASLLAGRPASRAATAAERPSPEDGDDDDDRRERLWSELRGARLHSARATSR